MFEILSTALVTALVLGGIAGLIVLFLWLKDRPKGLGAVDFYHPGEQRIYHYWDGEKKRSVDPVLIYRKYMDRADTFKHHFTLARSQHSQARKGYADLIDEICKLFDVKVYEEGGKGLTEESLMGLFQHFFTFNETLKKSWSSPTMQPTAPSPPMPPSEDANPTMSKPMDSGSSESAKDTDLPTPSPSESVSPTVSSIPEKDSISP